MDEVTRERFERIEATLERITERMDRFEVTLEVSRHQFDERLNKMLALQSHILESQDRAWDAIQALGARLDTLTANVEKLIRGRGPNGQA